MTPIQHRILIKRPVAEVFAFVTDFNNDKIWWEPVIGTKKLSTGETGLGSEFEQSSKVLFFTLHNRLQVTEWQPTRQVRFINHGDMLDYTLLYQFEAAEGGTSFTLEAELAMKGLMKVMQPIIMLTLHSQLETYFGILKAYLEGQG